MKKERLELFHTLQMPQVREVEREDGSRGKQFEGYAIVFDQPSVVMCDWWEGKTFREYIKADAISQEMLDKTDIICTAFHNREKLLARHHADGTGTMQLMKDEVGVKVRFEFANSPLGEDIAASVERGDMPGMSFSFYEDDYTYTDKKGADGIFERTIEKLDSIFEVTVASQPAYPGTSAKCREAWEMMMAENEGHEAVPHGTEHEEPEAEPKGTVVEDEGREAMPLGTEQKITRERCLADMQREIEIMEFESELN